MKQMEIHAFILPSRIIGIAILTIALVPLVLGAWLFFNTREFLRTASTTQGFVVQLHRSPSSEKDATFAPVVEFQDASGSLHTITSSWSSNPPSHAIGDSVVVHYNPANPADARLDGFVSLWLAPVICGVISIFPLFISLLFIWLIPFTIRRVWPRRVAGTKASSTRPGSTDL